LTRWGIKWRTSLITNQRGASLDSSGSLMRGRRRMRVKESMIKSELEEVPSIKRRKRRLLKMSTLMLKTLISL